MYQCTPGTIIGALHYNLWQYFLDIQENISYVADSKAENGSVPKFSINKNERSVSR